MKMVILGGGSKLGNRVPMDLMAAGDIEDFEVVLVDIDPGRLELVSAYLQRAAEQHRKSLKIETTTDRRRAIEGADYVIIVISVGGPAFDGFPYYEEIMIPRKYGVDQSIGDTVNPGGVFRALRTAPVFIEILRDVEEICPKALVLNYINPMAIFGWPADTVSSVEMVGFCHSARDASRHIADYTGIPLEESASWSAGINHMAWVLEFGIHGSNRRDVR